MTIYALSTITICYVTSPPEPQEIGALVRCDGACTGPGGGPIDFGTVGTKPNLVQ
jgi:hypothetical protein